MPTMATDPVMAMVVVVEVVGGECCGGGRGQWLSGSVGNSTGDCGRAVSDLKQDHAGGDRQQHASERQTRHGESGARLGAGVVGAACNSSASSAAPTIPRNPCSRARSTAGSTPSMTSEGGIRPAGWPVSELVEGCRQIVDILGRGRSRPVCRMR